MTADGLRRFELGDVIGLTPIPGETCDAADATVMQMPDGTAVCRCVVCPRCGHHTGNSHQGHNWGFCKVTRTVRTAHFCCPDPGCELEERWKPVPGYEGFYDASDQGFVRSIARPRTPGKVLRPSLGGSGGIQYRQVILSREGEVQTWKVHHLVLLAFVGPMPAGRETRHGPGGPLDNRLLNLSYGTHAENMQDQFEHGSRRRSTRPVRGAVPWAAHRGEGNPAARLTWEIVSRCRTRHAAGERVASLAREFSVSYNTMWFAMNGKTWVGNEFGCELEPGSEATP